MEINDIIQNAKKNNNKSKKRDSIETYISKADQDIPTILETWHSVGLPVSRLICEGIRLVDIKYQMSAVDKLSEEEKEKREKVQLELENQNAERERIKKEYNELTLKKKEQLGIEKLRWEKEHPDIPFVYRNMTQEEIEVSKLVGQLEDEEWILEERDNELFYTQVPSQKEIDEDLELEREAAEICMYD